MNYLHYKGAGGGVVHEEGGGTLGDYHVKEVEREGEVRVKGLRGGMLHESYF